MRPFEWSACAVLASTNDELVPIRTLCERRKIPVRWSLDGGLPLVRVREVDRVLKDPLRMRAAGEMIELVTARDVRVAVLAKAVKSEWQDRLQQVESVRVLALCGRRADDVADPDYRERLRADSWEIPVVEVVWQA